MTRVDIYRGSGKMLLSILIFLRVHLAAHGPVEYFIEVMYNVVVEPGFEKNRTACFVSVVMAVEMFHAELFWLLYH